tara:strand:+ start:8277 stop:8423 length:147 start_codon:yes stop_codon:yes gene_type:complete
VFDTFLYLLLSSFACLPLYRHPLVQEQFVLIEEEEQQGALVAVVGAVG